MKMKHFNILTIMLLGLLVMFSACEDKDDYDYNAIEPIIFQITGPTGIPAHGLSEFPYRYSVPYRGGSSYAWVIGGHGGTFVVDETYPSIIYVTFNQAGVDTDATITTTETTKGGKESEPFSRTIDLTAFCPEDMAPWGGKWYSHNFLGDDDYGFTEPDVEVVTTALNTLKIYAFFDWVAVGFWEENWDPLQGGAGNAIIEFDCNNTIKIDEQLLGVTFEWGPYWLWGTGTFDPNNETMVLNYSVGWSAGDEWNSFTATYTRAMPGKGFSLSSVIPSK